MEKRVLITGVSGFAGSFLAEYLLSLNYDIVGTIYSDTSSRDNIHSIENKIKVVVVNLLNKERTLKVIEQTKPEAIFHLAAIASPAYSFKNPEETIMNNITAQINLLEGVRLASLNTCRVLIISSADIYGRVDSSQLPIDEDTPLLPDSPYAVSKIAQDYLGLEYFITYGMHIVRVRPFNHIGPRQSPDFVISAFAKKIAEIEKGKMTPVLRVGNLEAKRDFTDVRDMVTAYLLAIEKCEPGQAYNIGSGVSHKISEMLKKLLSLSQTHIKIETDQSLFRLGDVPERLADATKFITLTAWKPQIPLEQTLKETLDYWRNIV